MGHWSDSLLDDALRRIGGSPDREEVRRVLRQSSEQIEILAGRRFGVSERRSASIAAGGLPFAEVPDLQVRSVDAVGAVHPVPDPVNPLLANVVQVEPLLQPLQAAPVGDALFHAGLLVSAAARSGGLTRDLVIRHLGAIEPDKRIGLFRQLLDPGFRYMVPILAGEASGWWFQLTRRLTWVSQETPDEGRLLEPLFDPDETEDGKGNGLAAYEAVLAVVRLDEQPSTWAFTARVWPPEVQQPTDRPWPGIAKAVHGHGVPILTVDEASTDFEVACQVLMIAFWHGYLGRNEPSLAHAVSLAFPKQVEKVRSGTSAPDSSAAAALLLEGLLHPGFDPARGAEATRRYIWRKASITVMEHLKAERVDSHVWTRLGISERRFYKLLPRFASKVNGRYDFDRDVVEPQMREYLDSRGPTSIRAAARQVLLDHGFSEGNARKWLQRHPPEQAVFAWPRAARATPR